MLSQTKLYPVSVGHDVSQDGHKHVPTRADWQPCCPVLVSGPQCGVITVIPPKPSPSHGHVHLNLGMWVVVHYLKVLHPEVLNVSYLPLDDQLRERAWLPLQLSVTVTYRLCTQFNRIC